MNSMDLATAPLEDTATTDAAPDVSCRAILDSLLDPTPMGEIHSLERILAKLSQDDQAEAMRILYGDLPETLPIPAAVQAMATTSTTFSAIGAAGEDTVLRHPVTRRAANAFIFRIVP